MALKLTNQTFARIYGLAEWELNAESFVNWKQSCDSRKVSHYQPYKQKIGF